jgi:catechol 2,3-dioxygenase-like lactoylglutathione lyase family enzyme
VSAASGPFFAGIQQVGVGVADAAAAFAWYRRHFGFDVRVFDDEAEARLMTRYTAGRVERRRAILALNMAGGGGLEIWQFRSRAPAAPASPCGVGQTGILAARLKTADIAGAHARLRDAALTDVRPDPSGAAHFFVHDPYGNVFEIAQRDGVFSRTRHPVGGVAGVMLGVSSIERSRDYYARAFGFDRVVFDRADRFDQLRAWPGGGAHVRWVRLARTQPPAGAFSRLLGAAEIDLIQAGATRGRAFDGRLWGDLGFIHCCFDVRDADVIHERSAALGQPPTIDSAGSFDMGEAAGRFSYVEDPDGTLLELVETHRVPILKALGWSLDLRKRAPDRPLPDLLVRGLAFNRVRE